MRSVWYWVAAFAICLIVVFVTVFFPEIGIAFGGLATEIIATFVGFVLAISFSEIARYASRRERAKRLTRLLVRSVNDIITILREGEMEISLEVWEMAITTGGFELLDERAQRNFMAFFGAFRYYNRAHEVYDLSKIAGIDKGHLARLWEDIKGTSRGIINMGEKILTDYSELLPQKKQ
ncbi:MAG: hypothetical protein ACFFD9_09230 [Candidatus Thorarchaeota archaeon]